MASCQQFDIAEAPFQEEEKQMSADYNMSSKGNEDVEFAYVRVGVYEAVENHSVTITRMWIEGRNSSIELPVLGNNIVAVEAISDNADAPTFDTENGDWTKVAPSGSSTDIMVHFDALVTCENGGSYTIPVNDARIKIKAQRRSGQIHGRFRSGSGQVQASAKPKWSRVMHVGLKFIRLCFWIFTELEIYLENFSRMDLGKLKSIDCSNFSVMIVDDIPINSTLLQKFLEPAGFKRIVRYKSIAELLETA